jgi:hypothetical protein
MRHSFAYAFVMFVVVSLCVGQNTSPATGNAPLLLRQPAVSKTQIVLTTPGIFGSSAATVAMHAG